MKLMPGDIGHLSLITDTVRDRKRRFPFMAAPCICGAKMTVPAPGEYTCQQCDRRRNFPA
jgi:hypothetical protein